MNSCLSLDEMSFVTLSSSRSFLFINSRYEVLISSGSVSHCKPIVNTATAVQSNLLLRVSDLMRIVKKEKDEMASPIRSKRLYVSVSLPNQRKLMITRNIPVNKILCRSENVI